MSTAVISTLLRGPIRINDLQCPSQVIKIYCGHISIVVRHGSMVIGILQCRSIPIGIFLHCYPMLVIVCILRYTVPILIIPCRHAMAVIVLITPLRASRIGDCDKVPCFVIPIRPCTSIRLDYLGDTEFIIHGNVHRPAGCRYNLEQTEFFIINIRSPVPFDVLLIFNKSHSVKYTDRAIKRCHLPSGHAWKLRYLLITFIRRFGFFRGILRIHCSLPLCIRWGRICNTS